MEYNEFIKWQIEEHKQYINNRQNGVRGKRKSFKMKS
jgi:hypothetical protein